MLKGQKDMITELDARVAAARLRMRLLHAYDAHALSEEFSTETGDHTMVQQSFKDEVDINTIVRRFGVAGAPRGREDGVYGDFTGITDFESAVEAVELARSTFLELPADVREEFDNDPGKFLRHAMTLDDDELDAFGRPDEPEAPPAPPAAPPPPEGGDGG